MNTGYRGFEMETVLGFPEGCVGGLKRAGPRYVVGGVIIPNMFRKAKAKPQKPTHTMTDA